jgi:hypothetical protein
VRAVTRRRRLALRGKRAELEDRGAWRSLPDRIAGAALGVVHSSLLCLAGALAVSGGAYLLAEPPEAACESGENPEPSHLLGWLRRSSSQVADIAARATLAHLPRVDTYAVEVSSFVTILNASPEEQDRLVRALNLERLAELPVVADAVADREFRSLIQRAKGGNVTAIYAIARHPRTERLMACPELRDLAQRCTPSELVKVMASGASR